MRSRGPTGARAPAVAPQPARLAATGATLAVALVVALAAGLVLTAPTASAQSGPGPVITGVVLPVSVSWERVPDALPGTFQAQVVLETTIAGGTCWCAPGTTSDVLVRAHVPATMEVRRVDPARYTIDWWDQEPVPYPGAHHRQAVNVTFWAEDAWWAGPVPKLVIEPVATMPAPGVDVEEQPRSFVIPLPEQRHPTELRPWPEALEAWAEENNPEDPNDVPGPSTVLTLVAPLVAASLARRAGSGPRA